MKATSASSLPSGPSSGKILTEDLIISKTKCASLSAIKNLNLWGSDIEDISILRRMPNAEVLSLSVNRIAHLHDLSGCLNLQELYLRKNAVADIHELRHLAHLKSLKVLWLLDNPCTDAHDYRKKVIAYLPNLLKLDNTLVSPEEKADALLIQQSVQSQKISNEPKSLKNESRRRTVDDEQQQQHQLQSQQSQQQSYYRSNEPEDQLDKELQLQQQKTQNQWRQSNTTTTMTNVGSTATYSNNQTAVSYNQETTLLQHERQNQNIVCAILSLAQDLDPSSLEIIRRNVIKQMQHISN